MPIAAWYLVIWTQSYILPPQFTTIPMATYDACVRSGKELLSSNGSIWNKYSCVSSQEVPESRN